VDEGALRQLLADLETGAVSPDEAVARLRRLPFADLGFARVDHHRALRQGLAEAVYAPGKTPEQCAEVVSELLSVESSAPILLTRADDAQVKAALAASPTGTRYGSTVVWRPAPQRSESVSVLAAGTADLPVADECAVTLEAHGLSPVRANDVGVAGIHRLLASLDTLETAQVVIVVAGMEGALVIAVPTSVGYGAGLEGITALLSMLASCAAGVAVVGIDNGFGAACAALRLLGPVTRSGGADG
jgi:hypothetical protein